MILTWNLDPVALSFASVSIHWYGLFFASALLLGTHAMKGFFVREQVPLSLMDQLFYAIVAGVIIGARLLHCLAYEPDYYLARPLEILYFWQGGLASHGGGLGALIGAALVCHKKHISLWWLLDRMVFPTLIFAVMVRLGNFCNSEIYGTATDQSWGVIFERIDQVVRHPVQLYEAIAYAIALGIMVISWSRLLKHRAASFGLFLVLVFLIRIALEFFKVEQATYQGAMSLTVGQWLSVPFIVVGLFILFWSRKQTPALPITAVQAQNKRK